MHDDLKKMADSVKGVADAFEMFNKAAASLKLPIERPIVSDYHGKRMPSKDWKKRQARRRMQKQSRKAART